MKALADHIAIVNLCGACLLRCEVFRTREPGLRITIPEKIYLLIYLISARILPISRIRTARLHISFPR